MFEHIRDPVVFVSEGAEAMPKSIYGFVALSDPAYPLCFLPPPTRIGRLFHALHLGAEHAADRDDQKADDATLEYQELNGLLRPPVD